MSLRIKNFERFQHYRDRNPPWIKLYTQLLDDRDFLALSDAARGQLVLLWLLAARMGNPLPDDARLLAGKIGSSGRLQLEELVAAGWLIREDASTTLAPGAADDASKMLAKCYQDASDPLAECYQNASTLLAPSRARARDRDRGERQRQNKHPPTHPPAACVSDSAMNGTNGGKPGRVDPDGFPEAWAAYPRREGGNPRGAAVRAYRARLRAGVAPPDLLAGVERYRAYCEARGLDGTPYVKQAATFFGPDGHYAESWAVTAPVTPAEREERAIEERAAALRAADDAAWAETQALIAARQQASAVAS